MDKVLTIYHQKQDRLLSASRKTVEFHIWFFSLSLASSQDALREATAAVSDSTGAVALATNHPNWELQDRHLWFQVKDDAPSHWLRSVDQSILHFLSQIVGHKVNAGRPRNSRYRASMNSAHRLFVPGDHIEFRLDFTAEVKGLPSKGDLYAHLVQPLTGRRLLPPLSSNPSATINFIVPLSSVGERFHRFVRNFEDVCLRRNENVHLTAVVFPDVDEAGSKGVEHAVEELQKNHPAAQLKIVKVSGRFSRARALHSGALSHKPNDLLFFCDVDIIFSNGFLRHCRTNTARGTRVFFPIAFTNYSPELVRFAEVEFLINSNESIHRERGHWFKHSFGMTCLYVSDYVMAGGFNLSITGWGGEDVDLVNRFINHGYDIFRALEPGLIHQWHPKACTPNLTPKQLQMCMASKADTVGSKHQLAILRHRSNT